MSRFKQRINPWRRWSESTESVEKVQGKRIVGWEAPPAIRHSKV